MKPSALLYAASGAGGIRVGGGPSSLEAASSQTWASSRWATRTSAACASCAHLKHSSAIARYSVAVFIGRYVPQRNSLAGFPKLVCFKPDSTKELWPLSTPRLSLREAWHQLSSQQALSNSSGSSFATLAAIRRASSLLSSFAAERRPGSSSK